jgi:hypothetical protein
MVDEAGVGSNKNGREGVEPLIIFDGSDALTEVKTRKVSKLEEYNATKRYIDWHGKANRRRKGSW